jgi:hypothetical protein
MFRIYQLPYGERDGYYTREQIIEAVGYLQDDITPSGYEKTCKDHLHRILSMMDKYSMGIILAREVIPHDEFCDIIVGTHRIRATPFKATDNPYIGQKITAPNFGDALCCGNCAFFDEQTDQDEDKWGYCSLHTETKETYDPPLKVPLELSGDSVCDSFAMRDD